MPQQQLLFADSATLRAERFRAFHQANPHVYRILVRWVAKLRANPRVKRWGIRNLWEKLRWEVALDVVRLDGGYKLNDHYPPFYARLLLRDYPELDGWLEIRGKECELPEGV